MPIVNGGIVTLNEYDISYQHNGLLYGRVQVYYVNNRFKVKAHVSLTDFRFYSLSTAFGTIEFLCIECAYK